MLKVDAVILGSPTYLAAVSADLKALIERAGYVAYANNHVFQMSRMIIPGSTYWNMGFGLDKGDVRGDEEGLVNMRHLGNVLTGLVRLLNQILPIIQSLELRFTDILLFNKPIKAFLF